MKNNKGKKKVATKETLMISGHALNNANPQPVETLEPIALEDSNKKRLVYVGS